MIYLSSVVVFGLLQIWMLLGFLTLKGISYNAWDLIKDGGLFIFASSLVITTYINHKKIFDRTNKNESYWSFFTTTCVILISTLGFITSISVNSKTSSFEITTNIIQNWSQVACTIISISYGFVVERRLEKALEL